MTRYQYKVVPAPPKGIKAKGVKTAEERFALSVEQVLNQMGAEGWEYLRAELLPSEERSGLTGTTVNWRNMLVFRRALEDDAKLPVLELAKQAAEKIPLARPVPGRDAVRAPAPIPAESADPPMSFKSDRDSAKPAGDGDEPDKP